MRRRCQSAIGRFCEDFRGVSGVYQQPRPLPADTLRETYPETSPIG
ncbi:hypothetical protein AKJ09_01462 [Labilithrix luteola]|uniref:Uncharacterized protein n=1 Tax=Labilithrix luteola TaxID=1391654 RepID=A0A0K1PMP7_9BACT|nr:hypothetical protein AKJ09_01462 [Labilithrix luteola]